MSWLVGHLRSESAGAEADSYALVLAVFADDADALARRLAAGADPNASNAVRYPPLTLAARLDRAHVVRRLLDAGADPNSGRVELDEASPLHQAARGGSLGPARLLLDAGADPNKLNARGFTPLHLAALYDRPAVAAALLAVGTDPAVRSVDAIPEIGEYTAFDFAVERGRPVVADTLLAWAARHAPDPAADRLAQAALRGRLGGLALGDPDAPSTPGATPLALAARFGHADAVGRLLAAGADPDRRSVDRYHATPLMQAVAGGHGEAVDLLLAAGAEVDARDRYGRTALAWAAASGSRAMAERLLAAGADRAVRGLGRLTAADVARARGDTGLAALLDR
ncbi:ankyrin repeat domain-containing protein [Rubrivirga sp.]|uniref:ankyrin repeat domain-containing protein n=1 Tax=Rubrivirga sp. TaxID=1885344 RepID=UPI003B522FFA